MLQYKQMEGIGNERRDGQRRGTGHEAQRSDGKMTHNRLTEMNRITKEQTEICRQKRWERVTSFSENM